MIRQLLLFIIVFVCFHPALAQDDGQRITLSFVGDIMGHGPQIASAEIIKNEKYDYKPCFKYIKPIIREADLAIGNLELTLPGRPPYQGYPVFRSPDELAIALRDAGFDFLTTANNHSYDGGKHGIIATQKTIKDLGFYQTGTFKNALDRKIHYPKIIYKNGFKLVFLNYTFGPESWKDISPPIINTIDTSTIKEDMREARKLNADAIIVLLHWGKEYQLEENTRQQKLAKQLAEWGADIIIGGHPHVVQPIREETVLLANGKEKKVLVAYSLGNFISNQLKENTDGGIIFEIELVKKVRYDKAKIARHQFIPVWRFRYTDRNEHKTFFTVPISAYENNPFMLDMSHKELRAMKEYADALRKHLANSDSTERLISIDQVVKGNVFAPKISAKK